MTEPVWDFGYLSLPAEVQAAIEAGPPPSGRIRIEIVADELGRQVGTDYEADMAYFTVRAHDGVARSDVKQEDNSLILDYDEFDELVGVEVFLVNAAILPRTFEALKRVLGCVG